MKYFVVDAFANRIFEGNPAGVCVMEEWVTEELMQKIAFENNLSETAFAVKEGESYHLRWFTPGGEIDLCGHATLATAFVILNYYEQGIETVRFTSKSGELIVNKKEDLYELDFPTVYSKKLAVTEDIIDALGVTPIEAYLNRDLVLVLETEDEVRAAKPDFEKLSKLEQGLGVSVTAASTEFDFISRAFFPKIKINEDPVTGSLHCSLVPIWSEKLGKKQFMARQVSKRGGTLYCKLEDSRVKIAGKAALYSIGELYIDTYR